MYQTVRKTQIISEKPFFLRVCVQVIKATKKKFKKQEKKNYKHCKVY